MGRTSVIPGEAVFPLPRIIHPFTYNEGSMDAILGTPLGIGEMKEIRRVSVVC